jgi:hypothetical protein
MMLLATWSGLEDHHSLRTSVNLMWQYRHRRDHKHKILNVSVPGMECEIIPQPEQPPESPSTLEMVAICSNEEEG